MSLVSGNLAQNEVNVLYFYFIQNVAYNSAINLLDYSDMYQQCTSYIFAELNAGC